MHDRYVCIWY